MTRRAALVAVLPLCPLAAPVGSQEAVLIAPDLAKLPGAINPDLTQDVICSSGFSTKTFWKARKSERKCVLSRYGGKPAYAFTYDHIIPLELGGADTCDNLWPEPRAESFKKDQLEHALQAQVCACDPSLPLATVQELIRTNWIAAYAKYVTPKGAPFCSVNP